MQYLEAVQQRLDKDPFVGRWRHALFAAGGMTGCPDWQLEVRDRLEDSPDWLVLLNPKQRRWPIQDPNAARDQIQWEFDHLQMASAVLFWFPQETLCPIALFELGKWLGKPIAIAQNGASNPHQVYKPLFVGCHPNYARKFDVVTQVRLERKEVEVVHSLGDLVAQVQQWIAKLPDRESA